MTSVPEVVAFEKEYGEEVSKEWLASLYTEYKSEYARITAHGGKRTSYLVCGIVSFVICFINLILGYYFGIFAMAWSTTQRISDAGSATLNELGGGDISSVFAASSGNWAVNNLLNNTSQVKANAGGNIINVLFGLTVVVFVVSLIVGIKNIKKYIRSGSSSSKELQELNKELLMANKIYLQKVFGLTSAQLDYNLQFVISKCPSVNANNWYLTFANAQMIEEGLRQQLPKQDVEPVQPKVEQPKTEHFGVQKPVQSTKRVRSYNTAYSTVKASEPVRVVETPVEEPVERAPLMDTTGIHMLPLHPELLPAEFSAYLNEKWPMTVELFMRGYEVEKKAKKVVIPGCYVIYDLNENKYYVGQASDIWRRVREHIVGKSNRKGIYQQIDANILAGHTVMIRLIANGTAGIFDLNKMERMLIAAYDSVDPNGYNLTQGNGVGTDSESAAELVDADEDAMRRIKGYPYCNIDVDITRKRNIDAYVGMIPMYTQMNRPLIEEYKMAIQSWHMKHPTEVGDDDHAFVFRFVRFYAGGDSKIEKIAYRSLYHMLRVKWDEE